MKAYLSHYKHVILIEEKLALRTIAIEISISAYFSVILVYLKVIVVLYACGKHTYLTQHREL